MTDSRDDFPAAAGSADDEGWAERAGEVMERVEEAVDGAVDRVEDAVDEAAESLWRRYLATARERRAWVLFPSFLALVVQGISWLVPRTHVSAILMLLLLALLFALQLWLAQRTASGWMRFAAIGFSAVLFYFAVFGSAYSLYASFGGHQQIFFSTRLGEAYFISTSMGTGTGTLIGLHVEAAPDAVLAVIMHLQLVVLAVTVAVSAALAVARAGTGGARSRKTGSATGKNGD